MRNVIFVAPFPADTTYRFVAATAALKGVRLLGIVAKLPAGPEATHFDDVVRVQDPLNTAQLIQAARKLHRKYGGIHRVVGILEPIQVALAQIRHDLDVPGPTPEVAELFRDKGRMKDELRRHGFPCARHAVITTLDEGTAFAADVGYPIVIKPPAGMGCKATWRITSDEQLRQALSAMQVSSHRPAIGEEFLKGREYSFETITIGGEVRFTSLSRYYPTPLEVFENPWIQWVVHHPREITGPEFDDAAAMGVEVVKALGLDTGFTHMEWFRRDDGSLAIGEIAARPPGAQIVASNNFVHDADFHRAWARAVVDEAFDGPYERKYAVAAAFLRGVGHGRILSVTGVAEAHQKVGHLAVETRLPRPGMPRSDSYEGDGFVILRHPDTDVVREAARTVIETIRVHYG